MWFGKQQAYKTSTSYSFQGSLNKKYFFETFQKMKNKERQQNHDHDSSGMPNIL